MSNTTKFKNLQNKKYVTEDGPVWISRSCAVVVHVIAQIGNDFYFLCGKRGLKGDAPGLWNLPCGYIDWNENLRDAAVREVWEETGIDLNSLNFGFIDDHLIQPWFVNSEVSENRQNIAMHVYCHAYLDELPEPNLDNMEEEESLEARWILLHEIIQMPKGEWAFEHQNRIEELISKKFN